MNKVIIINHFDSFVFNLYRYVLELNMQADVINCDDPALINIKPSHLIFSPGPLGPNDTFFSQQIMQDYLGKVPILGICLGSLLLYKICNGTIGNATKPTHGASSFIKYKPNPIFNNIPNPLQGGLYHSLMMNSPVPQTIDVLATCPHQQIMAIKHKNYNAYGLQFHPESILTPQGITIIKNFLMLK